MDSLKIKLLIREVLDDVKLIINLLLDMSVI